MNLWNRILKMNGRQLFRFGILFLKNPLLVFPTLRASKTTLKVCNELFGKRHHTNGKENAFRHALWNLEICIFCQKRLKNVEKTTNWAQKVTNMYEKVTQNESLDEAMDYHNNAIGRMVFLSHFAKKKDKMIEFLHKMMENSVKIEKIEDINNCQNKLVYISD
ncbi:MAG: hypothetical protein DWP94_03270 [Flavobacterium sp.]|nr:MAG: hypothetical protein DWP94_03270 [Flavobacterium sp.]